MRSLHAFLVLLPALLTGCSTAYYHTSSALIGRVIDRSEQYPGSRGGSVMIPVFPSGVIAMPDGTSLPAYYTYTIAPENRQVEFALAASRIAFQKGDCVEVLTDSGAKDDRYFALHGATIRASNDCKGSRAP